MTAGVLREVETFAFLYPKSSKGPSCLLETGGIDRDENIAAG